jgi:hypothetical protein
MAKSLLTKVLRGKIDIQSEICVVVAASEVGLELVCAAAQLVLKENQLMLQQSHIILSRGVNSMLRIEK